MPNWLDLFPAAKEREKTAGSQDHCEPIVDKKGDERAVETSTMTLLTLN